MVNGENPDNGPEIAIKLDIQNYFDSIRVDLLLDRLNKYIDVPTKLAHKFDEHSRAQILDFMNFLSKDKGGIPQLDNDIVSSYLGYLYLRLGELDIDSEISQNYGLIEDHQITRYIDDIYIALKFKNNLEPAMVNQCVNNLGSRIADILHYRLGLRLNEKTRFFRLSIEDERKDFIKSLKKISREDYSNEDDLSGKAPERLDALLKELRNLKNTKYDAAFSYEKKPEEETLKSVFDSDVNKLLRNASYQKRLQSIFKNFNFDLVRVSPLALTVLIVLSEDAKKQYRSYLLALKQMTTREEDLVVKYLCQMDFDDRELLKALQRSQSWNQIIPLFTVKSKKKNTLGYYDLQSTSLKEVSGKPQVVEQIRLRRINEIRHNYSVALNHLTNELQTICWLEDLDKKTREENGYKRKELREFRAPQVEAFLKSQRIPHEIVISIRNMFERRNNNNVSHSGASEVVAQTVTEAEYLEYRSAVGKCLEHLL